MITRLFCLATALFVLVPSALAVPVAPIVVTVQQPDGYTFNVRAQGDEFASWTETLDGYTVTRQSDTWYYAIRATDGTLIASPNAVGATPPAVRSALPLHLRPPTNPRAFEPRQLHPLGVTDGRKYLTHTQNMVAVLVDYSDISFAYSDSQFRELIFGSTSSVYEYYRENSYAHFLITPASESYGVAGDGIIHVTRPVNHPNIGKGDSRAEAAAIFDLANTYIDFQSFDTNGDGTVASDELAVIFILAGYEGAYGDEFAYTPNVFAHTWQLATPLALDAVDVRPYAMFGERHRLTVVNDLHQATIGVMCHEAGHLMLGLPDLYDIDDNSQQPVDDNSDGVGNWGLMGSGSWNMTGSWDGDRPAHLCAWSKVALDITTPIDVTIPTTGEYVLQAYNKSSIKRLWVDPYRVREYYLLENRQQVGYDAGLPGNGLLIWHVDDSRVLNNDASHKWVDLEEADGLAQLDVITDGNSGDPGDPFPGSSDNRAFTDTSNPNSRDYGAASTGVAVTNIPDSFAFMRVDITPSVTGGTRDHIRYDEVTPPVSVLDFGTNVIWTAVRYTNNTPMNQLDGFEIYSGGNATVDFYLYESMLSNVPTSLLHTETGFSAVPGWNRFILSSPQAFPASADRTIVLKIASGAGVDAHVDTIGTADSRSWVDLDGNGIGSYAPLNTIGDFYQIALLGFRPAVASILRSDPSPTGAMTVNFTVTFSEDVTGVDVSDFALTTTGVIGAGVTAVAGEGNTRTITVNRGIGSGTIRLDVSDDDTIVNIGNSPLGGIGPGNGDFTTGETYTIDATLPVLSVTPTKFDVGYEAGDSVVTVTNTGGGTVNWSVVPVPFSSWSYGPTSGSLLSGASDQVTISHGENTSPRYSTMGTFRFTSSGVEGSPTDVVITKETRSVPGSILHHLSDNQQHGAIYH